MTNRKPRKATTVGALLRTLEADPEFVGRRKSHDDAIAERASRRRIEEQPILEDLRRVGFEVQSVWDLVNTSTSYTTAIQVLLVHLLRPYSEEVREGIARTLAVRDAAFAWPILVKEYLKAVDDAERPHSGSKVGLAVALGAIATAQHLDELIALVTDKNNGNTRIYVLPALRRSKSVKARETISALTMDPYLKTEIGSWKRKR
jgi:hypothetical protein